MHLFSNPSLHAKSRIAKTLTRHFACPSVAAAALGVSPRSLLADTSPLGMLFESLCVRDLRVYAQANKGEVFHYHDESGLEADAVVQTFLQVDHRNALPQLCRAVHAVEVAWGAI